MTVIKIECYFILFFPPIPLRRANPDYYLKLRKLLTKFKSRQTPLWKFARICARGVYTVSGCFPLTLSSRYGLLAAIRSKSKTRGSKLLLTDKKKKKKTKEKRRGNIIFLFIVIPQYFPRTCRYETALDSKTYLPIRAVLLSQSPFCRQDLVNKRKKKKNK